MSKYSDDYNALPFETRKITAKVMIQGQIRDLKFEKKRLKTRYNQSLKEINDNIKCCEGDLESDT